MVNKKGLQKLSKEHQVALEMACKDTFMHILLNYDLTNIAALERLRKYGIQLRRFNEPMMNAFRQASTNHLDQMAIQSEDFAYVYSEWKRFRDRFRATTNFTQFEPS
jgi:TRAP-type mannitol/chloroaromatic compound transport system substrate-binding protein